MEEISTAERKQVQDKVLGKQYVLIIVIWLLCHVCHILVVSEKIEAFFAS